MASQSGIQHLTACVLRDLDSFLPGVSDIITADQQPGNGKCDLGDPELDVAVVRCLSLARAIGKKFADDTDPTVTDEVALSKFLQANRKCYAWRDPKLDPSLGEYDRKLLRSFEWEFYKALNTPNTSALRDKYPKFCWDVCLDEPKIAFFGDNGPGTAIGASGSSWLEKFSESELTYTSPFVLDSFNACLRGLRHETESYREIKYGHAQVEASRLTFVPKTVQESRCIAIEPSLNVFFQKGIQFLLTDQLRSAFGIDLACQQEKNQLLALMGSDDQSFGTIDLSSASDTISMKMLDVYCPKGVLSWLKTYRTKFVDLPDSHGGQRLRLDMISSMGNAFTFPLQTIVFASAVCAVYNCHGFTPTSNLDSSGKSMRIFAVNGDDIIVVQECYDDVMRLLSLLGFTPNAAKSFNKGYFRESCGCDAFKGYNVRGVYCKTLKEPQDYLSLINRLNKWSSRSRIPLPETVGYLMTHMEGEKLFVPPSENDDAGIKVPLEALVNLDKVQALKQNPCNLKKPFYMGGYYYRSWEFRPVGMVVDEDWPYAEVPTVLASLKGEIRANRFVPRDGNGSYRIRGRSTHWWDSNEMGLPLNREDLAAMNWAVRVNLSLG